MYNKRIKIVFYELCLINFLFFLRWCVIYQILSKMQKINCYKKSQLPNSNKKDHTLKKLRLIRERLNKGTCVVNL